MKRYLLFCFDDYYPSGGWNDFVKDADTKEELILEMANQKSPKDNYHIVDTQTKTIVESNLIISDSRCPHCGGPNH